MKKLFFVLFLMYSSVSMVYAFKCLDSRGFPVNFVPNNGINDIAVASLYNGAPVVYYNTSIAMAVSQATREFFKFHECGHHALGHVVGSAITGVSAGTQEESEADCFAIESMYKSKMLNPVILSFIQNDIVRFSRNDWSHVPGPERAIDLARCLESIAPKKDLELLTAFAESKVKQKETEKAVAEMEETAKKTDQKAFSCLKRIPKSFTHKWNEDKSNPGVNYSFGVVNSCPCPVRGIFQVTVFDGKKKVLDGKSGKMDFEESSIRDYDYFNHSFYIPENGKETFIGKLKWNLFKDENRVSAIFMPFIEFDFPVPNVYAVFATDDQKCKPYEETFDENTFCTKFLEIYDAASFGDFPFEEIRGNLINKSKDEDGKIVENYSSKLSLPGVINPIITIPTTKSIFNHHTWHGNIATGATLKVAEEKFARFSDIIVNCFNKSEQWSGLDIYKSDYYYGDTDNSKGFKFLSSKDKTTKIDANMKIEILGSEKFNVVINIEKSCY